MPQRQTSAHIARERAAALRVSLNNLALNKSECQAQLDDLIRSRVCTRALAEVDPSMIPSQPVPISDWQCTSIPSAVDLFRILAFLNDDVPSRLARKYIGKLWKSLRPWFDFFHPAAGNVTGQAKSSAAEHIALCCMAAYTSQSFASAVLQDGILLTLVVELWRSHTLHSSEAHNWSTEMLFQGVFQSLLRHNVKDTLFREMLVTTGGDYKNLFGLITRRAITCVDSWRLSDRRSARWKVHHLFLISYHAVLIRELLLWEFTFRLERHLPVWMTHKWLHVLHTVHRAHIGPHQGESVDIHSLVFTIFAIPALWPLQNGAHHFAICVKKGFIQQLLDIARDIPHANLNLLIGDVLEQVEHGLRFSSVTWPIHADLQKLEGLPDHLQHRLPLVEAASEAAIWAQALRIRLMRVCASRECVQLLHSGSLRRCSCGINFYCSRSCQKTDWRARHRKECMKDVWDDELDPRTRLLRFTQALVNLVLSYEIYVYASEDSSAGDAAVNRDLAPEESSARLTLDLGVSSDNAEPDYRPDHIKDLVDFPQRYVRLAQYFSLSLLGLSKATIKDFGRLDSPEEQWWDRGGHFLPSAEVEADAEVHEVLDTDDGQARQIRSFDLAIDSNRALPSDRVDTSIESSL